MSMVPNAADVAMINRLLHELHETFNFDRSVGNMSLGKRMAEATADAIAVRSVTFQKGATKQWDENKSPYKEWKEKKYNVYDLAGVRTGQMLSHESLMGETEIHGDEVEMLYGTDTTPTASAASSYISDADKKVTDRQKAVYFTDGRPGGGSGRGGSQPERPFYELDEDIADVVFGIVVDALDVILKG